MKRTSYTFNPRFLYKAILGYLAYFAVFPQFLPALLNKMRGVRIEHFRKVIISPFVTIDSIYPELVEIEDGVYITRGCFVLSHFNPTDAISEIMEIDSFKRKVVIREGAFIGVNSVILPGVTVGRFATVRPGSVVASDVAEGSIVQGNPAVPVGRLPRSAVAQYLRDRTGGA